MNAEQKNKQYHSLTNLHLHPNRTRRLENLSTCPMSNFTLTKWVLRQMEHSLTWCINIGGAIIFYLRQTTLIYNGYFQILFSQDLIKMQKPLRKNKQLCLDKIYKLLEGIFLFYFIASWIKKICFVLWNDTLIFWYET